MKMARLFTFPLHSFAYDSSYGTSIPPSHGPTPSQKAGTEAAISTQFITLDKLLLLPSEWCVRHSDAHRLQCALDLLDAGFGHPFIVCAVGLDDFIFIQFDESAAILYSGTASKNLTSEEAVV
jgi:hypothetical protein